MYDTVTANPRVAEVVSVPAKTNHGKYQQAPQKGPVFSQELGGT